jgi:hypothetical protein
MQSFSPPVSTKPCSRTSLTRAAVEIDAFNAEIN